MTAKSFLNRKSGIVIEESLTEEGICYLVSSLSTAVSHCFKIKKSAIVD